MSVSCVESAGNHLRQCLTARDLSQDLQNNHPENASAGREKHISVHVVCCILCTVVCQFIVNIVLERLDPFFALMRTGREPWEQNDDCRLRYCCMTRGRLLAIDDVTQLTTANSKNKACLSEISPKTRLPRQVKEQAVRKYAYIYNIYSTMSRNEMFHTCRSKAATKWKQGKQNHPSRITRPAETISQLTVWRTWKTLGYPLASQSPWALSRQLIIPIPCINGCTGDKRLNYLDGEPDRPPTLYARQAVKHRSSDLQGRQIRPQVTSGDLSSGDSSPEVTTRRPRSTKVTRDHHSPPEITTRHPRSPLTTRGHHSPPEVTTRHPRSPLATPGHLRSSDAAPAPYSAVAWRVPQCRSLVGRRAASLAPATAALYSCSHRLRL